MPYARSAARKAFHVRATELRRSFRYAKVRPQALRTDIRMLVFHASVFHLSAAFEDYVLQSLTSWMYELQLQHKPNASLPTRLRHLLFLKANEGTLRNLIVTGSEREALDKLSTAHSGLGWLDQAIELPTYPFYTSVIREKKFPSPDNLDFLFSRFGLSNVLGEMSARTSSDIPLKMKSFMDVRNAIAHEFPPNITEEDLENYFESISLWVSTIDRILFSYVVRCSGSSCWQT